MCHIPPFCARDPLTTPITNYLWQSESFFDGGVLDTSEMNLITQVLAGQNGIERVVLVF